MSRRSPPKQLWYHDVVLFLPADLCVGLKKWVKEKVKAKEGNESHNRRSSQMFYSWGTDGKVTSDAEGNPWKHK